MAADDVPSGTELVWDEAERRLEAQMRQADALDTKAGALVGIHALAGGLVSSVAGSMKGSARWAAVGAIAGLVPSAWLSIAAFRTQDYDRSPAPEEMWRFADWDPEQIKLRFVSTRFRALDDNRKKLLSKARQVSLSLTWISVLALLVAILAIIGLVT